MFDNDRLTKLRALIGRLERLPASPESEWMLREARARMVDVETGERPSGMRPPVADPPAEAAPLDRDPAVKPPVKTRSRAAERRREPSGWPRRVAQETSVDNGPRPVDSGGSQNSSAAAFGSGELLWLEDSPSEDDPAPASDERDLKAHPWRRGLRG